MSISNQSVEKVQFWRSLLRQQPGSGMTVKEFCRKHGVSVPSFYAWRRKIAQHDLPMDQRNDERHDRLVPVQLVDSTGGNDAVDENRIEIVTPGGFTLRLDHRFPGSDLRGLLEAIASLEKGTRSC